MSAYRFHFLTAGSKIYGVHKTRHDARVAKVRVNPGTGTGSTGTVASGAGAEAAVTAPAPPQLLMPPLHCEHSQEEVRKQRSIFAAALSPVAVVGAGQG
jgi:hypothetical protein